MGATTIIGGLVALLLFAGSPAVETGGTVAAFASAYALSAPEPVDEGRLFKWEQDLRWFTFRLLKDIRRYAIRTIRLLTRSSDYWLAWLATSLALLTVGAVASAIDRRLVVAAWKSGWRIALAYASVGVVVFLRLLRDRRIPRRVRAALPLAILYGLGAGYWLAPLSSAIAWANQLVAVIAASRWFVRRCPDAVVEQHADYVRRRTLSRVQLSSAEQRRS